VPAERGGRLNAADGVDLVIVPMALESQGGLHPNWRIMYRHEQLSSFAPGRDERAGGAGAGLGGAHIDGNPAGQYRLVSKMHCKTLEC
jgi:hypothetical protein